MSNFIKNEFTLWQSFQQGDRDSFANIYHEYFDRLFEYGIRLNDDRDLVKDCIHDLFVKLWTNKNNLGKVANVKAYLLVSLRGTIFNSLQKKNKHRHREIKEEDHFELNFSVENELIKREQLTTTGKELLKSIDRLTPKQKEFIYLRYFEELKYDEIATILKISTKATYKLSARSLESLRDIYQISKAALLLLISSLGTQL